MTEERTGWRDQKISARHRLWGHDCPAVDIDFLMLEYDRSRAVAIVEYKHERARPLLTQNPSILAIIDMGNRAKLPVFAVRYADDFSWWQVMPLNNLAKQWTPQPIKMVEPEWISLLFRIRGRKPPTERF